MQRADDPSDKIGKLIDHIERIREELLAIQRSMEKMEFAKTSEDKNKK